MCVCVCVCACVGVGAELDGPPQRLRLGRCPRDPSATSSGKATPLRSQSARAAGGQSSLRTSHISMRQIWTALHHNGPGCLGPRASETGVCRTGLPGGRERPLPDHLRPEDLVLRPRRPGAPIPSPAAPAGPPTPPTLLPLTRCTRARAPPAANSSPAAFFLARLPECPFLSG